MSCGVVGVVCRCTSDLALLWLWRRPVATALIQPLAWEPPYAVEVAQEIATKKTKKNLLISWVSFSFFVLNKYVNEEINS